MTTAALRISWQMPAIKAVNWKLFFIAGLFLTFILLIFYAYQINELTKGAYLIKDYSKQIKILSQENKNLEINFAESSFLGQVEAKTEELGFKKTALVKYMQIMDLSFASAKQ